MQPNSCEALAAFFKPDSFHVNSVDWTSAPSNLDWHLEYLLLLSITIMVTCLCMKEDVANILRVKVAILKRMLHKCGVFTSMW